MNTWLFWTSAIAAGVFAAKQLDFLVHYARGKIGEARLNREWRRREAASAEVTDALRQ